MISRNKKLIWIYIIRILQIEVLFLLVEFILLWNHSARVLVEFLIILGPNDYIYYYYYYFIIVVIIVIIMVETIGCGKILK